MELQADTYWLYAVEYWNQRLDWIPTTLVAITLGAAWDASQALQVPDLMLFPAECHVLLASADTYLGDDACRFFQWARDGADAAATDRFVGVYGGDLVSYRQGDSSPVTLLSGKLADDIDGPTESVTFGLNDGNLGMVDGNTFLPMKSQLMTQRASGWAFDDTSFGPYSRFVPGYHLALGFDADGGLLLRAFEEEEHSCDYLTIGSTRIYTPTNGFRRERVEAFDARLGLVASASSRVDTYTLDDDRCDWITTHDQLVIRLAETSLGPIVHAVPGRNAQPENDFPKGAFPLVGSAGTAYGTNVGATVATSEPYYTGDQFREVHASVWWSFTAPEDGNLEVDTVGSSFDTVLGAVEDDSERGLLLRYGDDDGGAGTASFLQFQVTQGQRWYLAVAGKSAWAGEGDVVLNWSFEGPSASAVGVSEFPTNPATSR